VSAAARARLLSDVRRKRVSSLATARSGFPLAVALLVVGACSGGGGAKPGGVGGDLCAASAPGQPPPGTAPLRRLTRFEYGRALADLVGADPSVSAGLPPDEETLGFDDIADAYSVSALHAQSYLDVAEKVAADFVSRADQRAAVAGCDPLAGDAACAARFVTVFGLRAWRRPLDADEQAAMAALYQATDTPGTGDGLSAVVAAMLQSPQFLYRPEPGTPGAMTAQPLDGYALATRLSFLVLGRQPDAALLDDAASGRLDDESGLMAAADRLLADPRAAEVFAHFATEWWELEPLSTLDKDRSLYRLWTDGTPGAMAAETQAFLTDAWQGTPTLRTLLSAPATFVDADLAAFYGLPAPPGTGFQRVALDPARAAGLLTQGAFLATHAHADQTSPVLRGKFVRARLFCTPPPPPPPTLVVRPPTVDPRKSTRERFAEHTADPFCAGCHTQMDPIGFAFEHYDATGRWRDVDGSQPVDATGALTGTDVDGPLDGVVDLAGRLAGSPEVAACAATQWFRYALGRSEALPAESCALSALSAALTAPGGDFRQLVRATVRLPAFRTRAPEVQP
jgi:Protein of unknown function (DUF1588)/Protein of unknown function (DUF1592)/Protein of unknown function (DUF1587)/Protein of unknown function (DUF1595)/Protein of unknown function (DUF1585)